MIDFPLISNNGLPGNLVAESLEGIKITDLDIVLLKIYASKGRKLQNQNI